MHETTRFALSVLRRKPEATMAEVNRQAVNRHKPKVNPRAMGKARDVLAAERFQKGPQDIYTHNGNGNGHTEVTAERVRDYIKSMEDELSKLRKIREILSASPA